MKNKPPIAVFAYSFPHRKTHDFLIELVLAGYNDVCVIAAPWRKLRYTDNNIYYESKIKPAPPLDTKIICNAFGLKFVELEHNDIYGVKELKKFHRFDYGIISGARIIKKPIIDLFPKGIINIHPGKLPETSGLDLFFYTIQKRIPLGVTVHFIDHKVDAGRQIFFEKTDLNINDSPDIVIQNNYQNQIKSFRKLLNLISKNKTISTENFSYYKRNNPMTPEEKRKVIKEFVNWKECILNL